MLHVEDLSKSFGGLRALQKVSLAVGPREVFGLIGPNGAGKTTLLNVIAGMHKPDSGGVHLAEEDVTGLDPDALCRKGLSRTFQVPQSFPRMTVLENVLVAATFGGEARSRLPAEQRAREALEFVGFPLPLETPAASLNTAQLKRLDLARALASHPQVLLLDEIAAGLTPVELLDLIQLIRRIRETGVTLIVVEHLMRLILQVCDRVAFLQSGQVLAEGPPQHIAQDFRVVEAYLGAEN